MTNWAEEVSGKSGGKLPVVNSRQLLKEIDDDLKIVMPSSVAGDNITLHGTARVLEEALIAAIVAESSGGLDLDGSKHHMGGFNKKSLVDDIQDKLLLMVGYDRVYSESAEQISDRSVQLTSNSDLEIYKKTNAQDKELIRSFVSEVKEKLRGRGFTIPEQGQSGAGS
ncbi:MAG: hypothetical protein P8P30_11130 [Rickettsiales bacterium]|nr:hypothetical protein [Rickettsiales bacterium]